MKLISKGVSRAELEYMNIHPPPPISVLATALFAHNPCRITVLNDVIVGTSRDPRMEKHVLEKRTFRTFVIFCSKSVDVFRQIYRSKEQNLSVVY